MRVLLLGVLAAIGCGMGTPRPPTAALTVVLSLDGKPADRLSVQLVGADGQPLGSGVSDAAGGAAVYGSNGQPIPPGTYKLHVTDAGAAEENPMEVAKATKPRVPAAYARAAGAPASITVEAGVRVLGRAEEQTLTVAGSTRAFFTTNKSTRNPLPASGLLQSIRWRRTEIFTLLSGRLAAHLLAA